MFARLAHTFSGMTFLLLIGLLWPTGSVNAQTYDYGNAWYNSNVDYLRFKVATDGIYRVSAQQSVVIRL